MGRASWHGSDGSSFRSVLAEPSRFELPRCLEILGWDGRTRPDKDERKIVRRHLDKLEYFKPVGCGRFDEVVHVAYAPARIPLL